MATNAIRASYNRRAITVYQAYAPGIADPAVRAGRFVAPFNFGRMTWIKPSFLWLMARSNWGQKRGQERILAVDLPHDRWLLALEQGVLTSYHARVHGTYARWEAAFADAPVHIQWDPERNLRGDKLAHNSIQVGIGRSLIRDYAEAWIIELRDVTPLVRKIRDLMSRGESADARRLVPAERRYQLPEPLRKRLAMD